MIKMQDLVSALVLFNIAALLVVNPSEEEFPQALESGLERFM
jgi:hypothetical protein